ncbi:TetR family transcriptional regulator C-terminal domain-containing protein [Virgisporangium ochraceum]|uniref:TetR family transcriptional regulator n=1 Tax=Virgisporangium ochraceum TaxID=65505 RepID=A0A8J4A1U5_9ACTN|nr:TetR family transcriptional regulator C-terminal domain-containing protein [Virgisporangium ochraceum]GIJ72285.1 TetR family transcriptional regulator [Virgisporangium ochraceum]
MPKIVDPDARRRAVTDAVFRVIHRDGLEGASLRHIADEAGLAVGSVRHYFASHSELLLFALAALRERMTGRILGHLDRLAGPDPATPAEVAEAVLAEFLPLDEARLQETVVWLAFVTAARTRPELREQAVRLHEGARLVVRRVLDRAAALGRTAPGLDPALETERLSALLDGLAMSVVLHPDRLSPETSLEVLRRHLDTLRVAGG